MKNLLFLILPILIGITVIAGEGNLTSETKKSDSNSKLSNQKKAPARNPANNVTDLAYIGDENRVYKIVDEEENVVCYVATGIRSGSGSGYGNSIYCIKK